MSIPKNVEEINKEEEVSVDLDVSFSKDSASKKIGGKSKSDVNASTKKENKTKNKESSKKRVSEKKTTTYDENRGKNGQKPEGSTVENAEIGAKTPLSALSKIEQAMVEIERKKAEIDKLCQRHLMHYLENNKVHHFIINDIQNSLSTAPAKNFILGISAVAERYENNEVVNLTQMAKELASDSELSAKFFTEHVFPIIKTLRIFREPSPKKFRWANKVELEAMTAAVYKKPAAKKAKVEDVKQGEKDVDNTACDIEKGNKLLAFLNSKIQRHNESSLEKRKQQAIADAARDPYKKVNDDGSIEELPRPFEGNELSEEEKEIIRQNHYAKARAEIVAETANLQNVDYISEYAKKEADHNLKLQKEAQRVQAEMMNQNLVKASARNEDWQKTKSGLFNLVKIGGMFLFVALMLYIISEATSTTETSDYSITTTITTESENAPW